MPSRRQSMVFSVVALSYIFAETTNLEWSSMNATSHLPCSFTHFQSHCHSSLGEARSHLMYLFFLLGLSKGRFSPFFFRMRYMVDWPISMPLLWRYPRILSGPHPCSLLNEDTSSSTAR